MAEQSQDPVVLGCRCDQCPLGPDGWLSEAPYKPVPTEHREATGILFISIFPSDDEYRVGRPMVGRGGVLLNQILARIGKSRKSIGVGNIIRCMPPGEPTGAYERLVKSVQLKRKQYEKSLVADGEATAAAKRQAEAKYPHAIDCCRPALMDDIGRYTTLVPLGKVPFQALTGRTDAIGRVNGSPLKMCNGRLLEPDEKPEDGAKVYKIIATYNPAAALQSPKYEFDIRDDLKKVWRFHNDRLDWIDPVMTVMVSAKVRDRWLAAKPDLPFNFVTDAEGLQRWFDEVPQTPFFTFDTETDSIEPLEVQVEMAQFGTPALRHTAEGWELAQNDPDFDVPKRTISVLFVDELDDEIWEPWELDTLQDAIHPVLEDEQILIVGHNLVGYDGQAVQKSPWRRRIFLECKLRGVADTMAAVRFDQPDKPKGLKPAGVRLTDVERWENLDKGAKTATGRNDWKRTRYGNFDVAVNGDIFQPLMRRCVEVGAFNEVAPIIGGEQRFLRTEAWSRYIEKYGTTWREDPNEPRPFNLWEIDHGAQAMCVEMHNVGVHINQEKRTKFERDTRRAIMEHRRKLEALIGEVAQGKIDVDALMKSGDDDAADEDEIAEAWGVQAEYFAENKLDSHKFGGHDAVRNLLYDVWDLGIPRGMEPREFYTKTGQKSTSDKVIRAHLATGDLTPVQDAFLRLLRLARRSQNKVLGTTLVPLRPKALDPKRGRVWADGRVHSTFGAFITSVARLNSSGFNLQNVSARKGLGYLQELVDAAPGHQFVALDLEQAHLVVCANYWEIPILQQAFTEGVDAHNMFAHFCEDFDERGRAMPAGYRKFLDAPGWPAGWTDKEKLRHKPPGGTVARGLREFYKTMRYLFIYAGEEETAWLTLLSTETAPGVLPYLGTKLHEVARIRERFLQTEPEWEKAWAWMDQQYAANAELNDGIGYLVAPISGRRSGSLENGKKQAVANYSILETESIIMRMVEAAVIDRFPWGIDGPGTGVVAQIHDSVKIELSDKRDPVKVAHELYDIATVRIPGWDIPFRVEVESGPNWGALKTIEAPAGYR